MKDLYELGEMPPLGQVPKRMLAQVIRQDRFGEPTKAFQVEEIDVPEVRPDEVLVWVMAAGINYNNVWAALGTPGRRHQGARRRTRLPRHEPFHIGGSDASGIVWKVGSAVTQREGRRRGRHPLRHVEARTTRREGRRRSDVRPELPHLGLRDQLGQLRAVHARPGAPVPAEAEAPHVGSAGGLHAGRRDRVPHARRAGRRTRCRRATSSSSGAAPAASAARRSRSRARSAAIPVAVVSSDDKVEFCKKLGAKGCINRKQLLRTGACCRTGRTPRRTASGRRARAPSARALWEVVGERKSPRIVFEHPGEDTVPTSIFVCDTGGMVVICAGTTGYNAVARPALPLDAPEALPGLALRQRRASRRRSTTWCSPARSTRASRRPSRSTRSRTSTS